MQEWHYIFDKNFRLIYSFYSVGNLMTLEGAELLGMTKMIGGEYSSNYAFGKAFDSNPNRDENSLFHSLAASESSPQGAQITFDSVTRLHELTLVPRGNNLFRSVVESFLRSNIREIRTPLVR